MSFAPGGGSAVQRTQFTLGLLKNALLFFIQTSACAVDIEHQHGHG